MKRLILLLINIHFLAFAFGQQTFQLQGTVSSTDGELLPGVNVAVKGAPKGAITDLDGHYTLMVKQGDVLVFSYISFTSQTIAIKNQKVLDVVLAPDLVGLEEVVVVGYGKAKKLTMTGSVSAISAKEIRTVPTSNIQNALAGRLPGFFSQQRSGQPGKDASDFFIRGVSSLNEDGNQPLIIVDDVQYSYDQLQQINVNEIESISILKDASTTAIYGIKGANGVLVVKTRRGQTGAPKINVRVEGGIQSAVRSPDFLDSYETSQLVNEAYANDGLVQPFSATDIEMFRTGEDPYGHPYVNWYNAIFKDVASQQNANIDISGGTERLKYFITGGFFSQNGLVRNFEDPHGDVNTNYFYRRFNYRTNLDFDLTPTTTFRLDLTSRFMNINEPVGLNAIGEIYDFKKMRPYSAPFLNPDGSYAYHSGTEDMDPTLNARLANEGYKRTRRFDSNILFGVSQKLDFITKGLSTSLQVAFSSIDENYRQMKRDKDFYPSYRYDPRTNIYNINPKTRSYDYDTYILNGDMNASIKDLNIQYFLNYATVIKNNHNIRAMFLYNRQERTDKKDVPQKFEGYSLSLNYHYKNKYLFDFNAGFNGTDRFGKDNRFGFFPSVGIGWNIAEEEFFKEKFEKVNILKIRSSMGIVGSDATPGNRYLYKQIYEKTGDMHFGLTPTAYAAYKEGTLGNNYVTWEKARKFGVGIDATLFDKLSFTVDYFYDYRYDQLVEKQDISQTLGIGLPRTNLGETINQGFDGQISYNDRFKDVYFNTNFTFSYAKNEVKFQAEAQQRYEWLRKTGRPIGQPFGYTWNGYYSQQDINEIKAGNPNKIPVPDVPVSPGDLKYKDLNSDGLIDDFDKGAIGKPNLPTTSLGWTIGASYKGFSLSILFQGSFDYSFSVVGTGIESFKSQFQPLHLKRWTQERVDQGLPIEFPRLTTNPTTISSSEAYMSNFWLVDAWYIRMKTVELGYEFPKSLLPKGLSSLRLYTNAYNLFTWTSYDKYQQDPEIKTNTAGDAYMNQRVLNVGVQVSF